MNNDARRNSRNPRDNRRTGSGPGRFKWPHAQRNSGNGSANAKRNYERYVTLARAAALNGDTVEMENCYQHAEHYLRVMKAQPGDENS
jgi:hypothetical protein